MRRKRIMVMGPGGCGKTTLVNMLNGHHGPLRRTQDMMYGEHTIDVPGSYLELPWMYKHLIAASQDAWHILMLLDQSRPRLVYSPGFAKVFPCPATGILMKCDLAPENKDACIRQLWQAGAVRPYLQVSIKTGEGLEELKQYLTQEKGSRGGGT